MRALIGDLDNLIPGGILFNVDVLLRVAVNRSFQHAVGVPREVDAVVVAQKGDAAVHRTAVCVDDILVERGRPRGEVQHGLPR